MKWNAYAYGRQKQRSWRRSGKPNWKVNVKIYESLNRKAGKMRRRRRLHWLAAESGKTWLKVVEHATEAETETARERREGKRGRAGRERRKQKCGCCLRRRRGNNNVDYLNVAADGYTQHNTTSSRYECVYLCVCLVCPNIDLSHGQGRSWWWCSWCCWDNQKLLQLWEELSSLCGE